MAPNDPSVICRLCGGPDARHMCPMLAPPCRYCGLPVPWYGHHCLALRVVIAGSTADVSEAST